MCDFDFIFELYFFQITLEPAIQRRKMTEY
jgi:hypothetical protein